MPFRPEKMSDGNVAVKKKKDMPLSLNNATDSTFKV